MTKTQTFKACYSLFRVRMVEGLQYRVSAISGVFVSVFWAIIECVLYTVFYKHSQYGFLNNNGLSLAQVISYVWLAQGLFVLQTMSIDDDIMNKITNGDVGIELCRPLDLYFHWFAKSAAGKLGSCWLRGLFTIIVGFLMPESFSLGKPASLERLLFFIISVIMAFVLCSAFAMFVTAIRLNITWGNGPTYMLMLISGVLSGSYLPLRLWPDFMQTFLQFQPFAGFTDIPAQIYIGSMLLSDALLKISIQILWSIIFIIMGRVIINHRFKSIIIQGG